MASADQFDTYEYIGVIAPGAILLLGIGRIFPDTNGLVGKGDLSLGEFGVFLLAAYVLGQFVQAVGEGFEFLLWRLFTLPTDRPLDENQTLLSDAQRQELFARLKFGGKPPVDHDKWYAAVRQIYAQLQATNRTQRIDAFNRTYGLFRGLVVSCTVLAGLLFWRTPSAVLFAVGLLVLALLASQRMYSFGVKYGRELFVQYLASPSAA